MRRTLRRIGLALALAAMPAAAHERAGRAMGVVEGVEKDRISLKTGDGHSVVFTVTADTRIVRGEEPARLEDVHVGERAVVNGRRVGEELRAVSVKLAPAKGSR